MNVRIADQGTDHALEMLNWVKTHCLSYISNDSEPVVNNGKYWPAPMEYVRIFYFSDPADATLFRLKWL